MGPSEKLVTGAGVYLRPGDTLRLGPENSMGLGLRAVYLTSRTVEVAGRSWYVDLEALRMWEAIPMATDFVTKATTDHEPQAGGMVRSSSADKVDWTLVLDGPLLKRWMELLGRGAKVYKPRNWCLAMLATDRTERELTKERFRCSAFRHFMQWANGERDEDHAAAVVFNMNGYEAMLETDPK